ncbi:gamma-glutamylcyclotransferase [Rhizobiaceae bacterium BDR2-2]|uniref:glutathione-specific gamma-glutamylcyclotransferase n=1 Tax=Ectorhizobium quercum TaxID=2965071 RepID=A0AAE3N2V6_9HYPH|nr:gamma-glutamylcyclotransferase [Ectorhizobium quercum]MCX8999191.1 gamma-glutamylcyclotransferase [Ectorhizobium quercum]
MDEFWVFGYGSLMWNPGFPHVESAKARLRGYRRSLCIYSWVHRGTESHPGLVLGLDRGGSCSGVAFRVAPEEWGSVLAYLRERELVTNVYKEKLLTLSLADGRRVGGVVYVADPAHAQYAGSPETEVAARIVDAASGISGPNDAYLFNTLTQLRAMGIHDHLLEEIARHVENLRSSGAGRSHSGEMHANGAKT